MVPRARPQEPPLQRFQETAGFVDASAHDQVRGPSASELLQLGDLGSQDLLEPSRLGHLGRIERVRQNILHRPPHRARPTEGRGDLVERRQSRLGALGDVVAWQRQWS